MTNPIAKRAAPARGLTAVELAIATVVIAAVVAAAMVYQRERQRALLQATATAEPEKVFTLAAYAGKDVYQTFRNAEFVLAITNPTPYDLRHPWDAVALKLTTDNRVAVRQCVWVRVPDAEPDDTVELDFSEARLEDNLIKAGETAFLVLLPTDSTLPRVYLDYPDVAEVTAQVVLSHPGSNPVFDNPPREYPSFAFKVEYHGY